MIGRLFYLVAGAALGGYAVHRVNRARRALSPGGIAERAEAQVSQYKGALRELNEDLTDEVRAQEEELLRRYAPEPRALGESAEPSQDSPGGRRTGR